MKRYTCGFLFGAHIPGDTTTWVTLVRKNHPEWQAGKLNGVGGHIEEGETPMQSMQREFREETGLDIVGWRPFCRLTGPGFMVHFYECRVSVHTLFTINGHINDSNELIVVRSVDALHYEDDLIPNLRWLIPLALSEHKDFAEVGLSEVNR